jgi:hypothetical protein
VVLSRTQFAALLLAGLLIRAVALPGPGTGDLTVWKVWSYNARHGVGEIYGVGGTPPERRELTYAGASATVDYPPLALYELGLAGHAYWAWSRRSFPNATPLNAFVKLPAAAAEIGLALLLFAIVRAHLGGAAARLATIAYWLNPAALFDASILGYLDAQFVLPAIAALAAAAIGWPALAGALIAAAMLTKAQGIFVAPAVALAIWTRGAPDRRFARLIAAAAGGLAVSIAAIAPVAAAGGWPNMVQALGRLATHDMLSANAANLWWVIGYLLRAWYSMHDLGVWAALTAPARILNISRVVELGYPNPRTIGIGLTIAAIAWALWIAHESAIKSATRNPQAALDVWLLAAVGGFCVHAYAVLSAQVHENHLFAAVPLLVLASAGRRAFRPIAVGVSAVVALNLNLFYGFGEGIGYALPRGLTIIDPTVIVALVNCFCFMARAGVADAMLHGSRRPAPASVDQHRRAVAAGQDAGWTARRWRLEVRRHEEGDEREERRPDAGDQRQAGRHLADRHQPREHGRVRRRDALEIQVAPRGRRHGLRPGGELSAEDRRVGQPRDLADPLEEEKDPDADPQQREAGALTVHPPICDESNRRCDPASPGGSG